MKGINEIPKPDFTNIVSSRQPVRISDLPVPTFPEIDPQVQQHADEALAAKIDEVRKDFLYVDPETNEPVFFDEVALKWVEDKLRTPHAAMLQDQINRGQISPQTASQIRLNCVSRLETLKTTLEPEIVVDVLLGIREDMKDLFYYEDVKIAIQKEIGRCLGSFSRVELKELAKVMHAGSGNDRWEDAYWLLVHWDDKFNAQK